MRVVGEKDHVGRNKRSALRRIGVDGTGNADPFFVNT